MLRSLFLFVLLLSASSAFSERDKCKHTYFNDTTVFDSAATCYDCFIGCNGNPECKLYSWAQYSNIGWENDTLCNAPAVPAVLCALILANGTRNITGVNECMDCFYTCNHEPQCTLWKWNQSGEMAYDNNAYCGPPDYGINDSQEACDCESICDNYCAPAICTHIYYNSTVITSMASCADCFYGCNHNLACHLFKWNASGEMRWDNSAYCGF